ncbi:MAG: DUF4349 domain-containing protein [Actinomycetota bacterium]|nr:DUF4349 domain-containing protein [Actinomycetota bacterium]
MIRRLGRGLAVASLVVLTACAGSQGRDAQTGAEPEGEVSGHRRIGSGPAVGDGSGPAVGDGTQAAPQSKDAEVGLAAPAPPGQARAETSQALPPLPDPPPAVPGERIVKEGSVSLEVAEGGFDQAFVAVIATARRHGGTVVATTTTNDDDRGTAGSVTVRVPVERYEDLLAEVSSDIGEVRSRDITSQDVSAEYVDLQSRLRHLQAQERFYLGLLERAQSVADAIAVQQQLDSVESGIEQIKGRLQYLDERTAFSTLTVELFEPGATLPRRQADPTRPTLAAWWASGRDAFVNAVGVLLVAALFAAPLLVPAGVAVGVWRLLRRRPVAVAAQPE